MLGSTMNCDHTFRSQKLAGGTFLMGSSQQELEASLLEWKDRLIDPAFAAKFEVWLKKEYPPFEVKVAPFEMMRFPVTNEAYRAFLLDHPDYPWPESLGEGSNPDHPVWGVSLADAVAFGDWISAQSGERWRLPTEAEWEFAATDRGRRRYPFGNEFNPKLCNTIESGIGTATAVTHYPPQVGGLYDLAGNVEEWTMSCYSPYPGGEFIADDLVAELGPDYPILRGGSFLLGGDLARSRRRHGPHPGPFFRVTGFRLVKSA